MKTPTPEQRTKDTATMFEHVANFGGGPAHPQQIQYGMTDGVPNIWFAVGMTKREHIAALMLQGAAASTMEPAFIINRAVELADALLERLKK